MEHAIDLQSARAEDFEPHLGSDFRVAERSVLFTLARVERYQPQPRAPRPDPFALVFSGPPSVNQGMVALDHPTLGRIELFIVPIGPGPDGVHHYEAVFN